MLPDWMKQDAEKPSLFRIDSGAAHQAVCDELGYDVAKMDQYDLEIAFAYLKLAAQLAERVSGLYDSSVSSEHRIKCGPGDKEKWNRSAFPAGKYAEVLSGDGEWAFAKKAGLEARERFKANRGLLPG